jgi:hypothetical protein
MSESLQFQIMSKQAGKQGSNQASKEANKQASNKPEPQK